MRNLAERWELGNYVILLQSAALIGTLIGPSWLLHVYYFSHMAPGLISLALAFLAVIIAFIVGQLYVSCVLKYRTTVRQARSDAAKAQILQLISHYLHQDDDAVLQQLRELHRHRRKDFEACILQSLLLVKGGIRARLAALVREVGLLDRWMSGLKHHSSGRRKRCADLLGLLQYEPCRPAFERALNDRSVAVQAAAVRALLRFPDEEHREALIDWVQNRAFLVRLFAYAECNPLLADIEAPTSGAVFDQLLRFDQAIRNNDRSSAFALLDRFIADGDSHLAEMSAETMGSLVVASLRGDA